MRKILLVFLGLMLVAYTAMGGESMKRGPSTGAVRHGDLEVQGSIDVAGDTGGARIQFDCNTTAPTYDAGEAGIDCTETATDTRSKFYFQDTDGNRSMIGHSGQSVLMPINDGTIHATSFVCVTQLQTSFADSTVTCGGWNASTVIPPEETWIFHKAHIFVSQTVGDGTEECGVYFSYSSTVGNFNQGCATPDCATATQQPIAITGVAAPGGDYDDFYLNTLEEEYTHDLGDVEVADGGFWRLGVDEVHTCVGGTEADKPCWDVTNDTDCAGAGTCTQSGTACTVLTNITVRVDYSVYE